MARIRTIKPEFPQSESMGRVSRDARLCFVLLWTLADDEGRLRGNSRMLASLLFPYDDDAPSLIDQWLEELEAEGCIVRYLVDGTAYLEVCKWLSHQKIDRPSTSKIPPSSEGSRIVASPRESSSLDQGSRIKDQGRDQGSHSSRKRSATDFSPEFEEAWQSYPRRSGDSKADAFKAWCARLKSGKTAEAMIDGARRYAAFCEANQTEGRFIKQGATFFGPGLHFESDWRVPAPVATPQRKGFSQTEAEERQRRADILTGRAPAPSASGGLVVDMEPAQVPLLTGGDS